MYTYNKKIVAELVQYKCSNMSVQPTLGLTTDYIANCNTTRMMLFEPKSINVLKRTFEGTQSKQVINPKFAPNHMQRNNNQLNNNQLYYDHIS